MAHRSAKKLGRLGEKILNLWATIADITINDSKEDDTGWDFILEFPSSEEETDSPLPVPLDLRPVPLECFIQVKGTDGTKGSCEVKLDNWNRRVADPLPSFYLVFEFDGKDDPQRAYLVHIDREYIFKVKKRIRQLSVKGDDKLYKHNLTFAYNEIHRLSSLDGHCLMKTIRAYVPDGLHAYCSAKMEDFKNVGYEKGSHSVMFAVDVPDTYESDSTEFLVDHLVGLVPHVPLNFLEIDDKRFDIKVPGSALTFDKGILHIRQDPVGKVMVNFALTDFSDELTIETEAFAPRALLLPSDDKRLKIRMTRPFIEFIVRFNPFFGTINFKLPIFGTPLLLKELQPIAKLIQMVNKGSVEHIVIEQEFLLEGKRLMWGTLDLFEHINISEEMLECSEAITHAWTIAKYLGVQDEVKISTMSLMRDIRLLQFIASVLETGRGYVEVNFYAENEDRERFTNVCCPLTLVVHSDNIYMVMGFALLSEVTFSPSPDEKRGPLLAKLSTTYFPLLAKKIARDNKEAKQQQRRIHEQIANKHRSKYTVILLEDLHQYMFEDT